ncbi:MAG TPA: trypsin-like peptidase domain-containing protein, partial [Thermoanaerobaculia bacterium]|nr:trypsin-like peptidase domain-containing protein [Thermoanaerobaculia bacterium]
MSLRPRLLVAVLLLVGASCRRDVARLDDVQKMAYGVKPGVVRISAYATAEFHYDPAAIGTVESELLAAGFDAGARNVPGEPAVVTTGAGGSGSGFIIHPDGFILTSGHVVAPTRDDEALRHDLERNGAIAALVKHFPIDQLRAIHRSEEGLKRYLQTMLASSRVENIVVVNEIELSNGEKLPFRIVRYSPALSAGGTDLALLHIERKNLPVLLVGDSDTTRVGDAIWSIGYPAVASSSDEIIGGWLSRDSDLEATFNPGMITAIKRNVTNTPVFQSNVAIYRGNSGGPAVDRDGQVIGISTWGHTDAESIKFLVPIDVAKSVLAEARVPLNVDGEFSRHYRAALDAAAEGNWTVARTELDPASKLFPNSPDLIRFRRDIDRALHALPAWRLHPIRTGALAALILTLLAIAIAMLLPRRNRFPKELLTATTSELLVEPVGRHDSEPAVVPRGALVLGRFTILNGARAGQKLGLGGSGI